MSSDPVQRTVFVGGVPFCTTKEQYALWKRATAGCQPNGGVGFCEDCTPEYQRRMIRDKACENPGIRFFWDPPKTVVNRATGQSSSTGGYIYGAFAPGHDLGKDGQKVMHEAVETSNEPYEPA